MILACRRCLHPHTRGDTLDPLLRAMHHAESTMVFPVLTRQRTLEQLEPRLAHATFALSQATEFVYRLNEVRTDPLYQPSTGSGGEQITRAVAPLAIHPVLVQAAQSHATAMLEEEFFAHENPNTGSHPNGRIREAGYPLPEHFASDSNGVEFIAAGDRLQTAADALADLLADRSGTDNLRRDRLLGRTAESQLHTEIGVACVALDSASLANYWVLEIAHRAPTDRFLTGVVYNDQDLDGRYSAGEGIAGVTISTGPLRTTTDSTGAYSLPVNSGIHLVRATSTMHPLTRESLVRVENGNVQVDFSPQHEAKVQFRTRSLWTNYLWHLDANSSATVSPLDALLVINHLNRHGAGPIPQTYSAPPSHWIDTNGDGRISPLDALLIINHLNRRSNRSA